MRAAGLRLTAVAVISTVDTWRVTHGFVLSPAASTLVGRGKTVKVATRHHDHPACLPGICELSLGTTKTPPTKRGRVEGVSMSSTTTEADVVVIGSGIAG